MKKRMLLGFICIILLAVTLGEVFSRYYLGLGTPPLSVAHPTIEYMFKPNQKVTRFGNRFITNQYGMRTDDFPAQKRPGELRIMVYGDSVVNGGNLTDHARLATTILGRELQARTGHEVVVGNISAGSWGPGNWLAYSREYGFFDADIIVLVVSSHDSGDVPMFQPLDPATHPTEPPISALWEGIVRYGPRYIPGRVDAAADKKAAKGVRPAEVYTRGLGDLKTFLKTAQEAGRRVVVFQHWTKIELKGEKALPGNRLIIEACRELGIEPVSLAPYFRAVTDEGKNPYRDDIHPNDIGQAVLAQAFVAALSR